jgi:antitoxin component YwqK of YwqJK toxin-antitoxin module
MRKESIKRHNDGSLWAKGTAVDGVLDGYWEWFRKDGSKMRSGYFQDGKQTGKWTTHDKNGVIVKVTDLHGKTKGSKSPKENPPQRNAIR